MAELAYRALAVLLDYPSAELQEHTGEIAAALASLGAAPVRALDPLLADLSAGDLLELQERYVETFDRGRRTSLNLFEHVHGDSRDRGQAMVDLLAMYREAGLELTAGQLPDYLPAFLEYLSLLDDAAARARLADIAHILQAIGAALARRRSPYAAVFDVLLALAGERPLAEPAADAEDDGSPAALDADWQEAPVEFLAAHGPAGACGTTPPPGVQTIQIHRRSR
ncbi:MAG: nitrate reductase molybdenum cofactor assembly chaperone [Burkholderiaceae bacterium]|nr:nitrate reductase molybdenum cofactor assembly chaperone [Burkholderiaceae bacterium]